MYCISRMNNLASINYLYLTAPSKELLGAHTRQQSQVQHRLVRPQPRAYRREVERLHLATKKGHALNLPTSSTWFIGDARQFKGARKIASPCQVPFFFPPLFFFYLVNTMNFKGQGRKPANITSPPTCNHLLLQKAVPGTQSASPGGRPHSHETVSRAPRKGSCVNRACPQLYPHFLV